MQVATQNNDDWEEVARKHFFNEEPAFLQERLSASGELREKLYSSTIFNYCLDRLVQDRESWSASKPRGAAVRTQGAPEMGPKCGSRDREIASLREEVKDKATVNTTLRHQLKSANFLIESLDELLSRATAAPHPATRDRENLPPLRDKAAVRSPSSLRELLRDEITSGTTKSSSFHAASTLGERVLVPSLLVTVIKGNAAALGPRVKPMVEKLVVLLAEHQELQRSQTHTKRFLDGGFSTDSCFKATAYSSSPRGALAAAPPPMTRVIQQSQVRRLRSHIDFQTSLAEEPPAGYPNRHLHPDVLSYGTLPPPHRGNSYADWGGGNGASSWPHVHSHHYRSTTTTVITPRKKGTKILQALQRLINNPLASKRNNSFVD